ncbi:MAG: hypothetical protein LKJ90_08970 [Faecalibacterium sp.]|jgi:hypothetical protein|nr:hypothetical protein [Faecalibacterium sp.]
MKYERGPRFGLSENQQSFLYWSLRNFDTMPPQAQAFTHQLCAEIGGSDSDALFHCLTTKTPIPMIATAHNVSSSLLTGYVRKFYQEFVSRYTL